MTAPERHLNPVPDDPLHDGDGLFSLYAEQCVLGAAMLSRDALIEVAAIVRPPMFYRPSHARIFEVILELDGRGPVDVVTVQSALDDASDLIRVGGAPYLHTLIAAPPTAANGSYYARIVADRHLLREVASLSPRIERLVTAARTGGRGGADLLGEVHQWLADLEVGTATEAGPKIWNDVIPGVMDAIEDAGKAQSEDRTPGVPTGLVDLDRLLNGLHDGQLVILAGRPGMGKSVAAAGFAQHAAWRHNIPAVIFSLEMSEVELGTRLLSAHSRVPLTVLQTGQLHDEDWTHVARSVGISAKAPLFIDDSPTLTLADVRTRARALKRQHGLRLIVVDYLQLMSSPGRSESRQQEVANLSRGLKLLAKELSMPIIAVSQLNRGPENRQDKRPTKADLRESGALENDADVIILVHRDDYYDNESPRAGEADFIVDKNRKGPTDTITVAAQLHFSRFASMEIP